MDEKTLELAEEKPDKDKGWRIAQGCIKEGLLYLCVFLTTFLLFIFVKPFTGYYQYGAFAKALIAFALAGGGVFIAYMVATKRLKARHVAIILLVAG